MNALGPTDRCTPSQAQAMGQQVLAVIALHEKNTLQLPREFPLMVPLLLCGSGGVIVCMCVVSLKGNVVGEVCVCVYESVW